MIDRRETLARSAAIAAALAGAGLLPRAAQAAWQKAAFDAKGLADVVKALGGAAPTPSKEVSITAPDIAENSAAVQLSIASTLPGVKRMALLVEKNPFTLAAVFDLGEGMAANVGTRIKMAESSNVYAVAMLADGRVHYTTREVKVTIGGCG